MPKKNEVGVYTRKLNPEIIRYRYDVPNRINVYVMIEILEINKNDFISATCYSTSLDGMHIPLSENSEHHHKSADDALLFHIEKLIRWFKEKKTRYDQTESGKADLDKMINWLKTLKQPRLF